MINCVDSCEIVQQMNASYSFLSGNNLEILFRWMKGWAEEILFPITKITVL